MLLLKSFSFCFSLVVVVAVDAAVVVVAEAVLGTLIWSVHGEKPPSTATPTPTPATACPSTPNDVVMPFGIGFAL